MPNAQATVRTRSTLRRAVVLSAVVALLVGITAIPAGAKTPDEVRDRFESDTRNALGQLGNIAEGLEGQARNDLNAAVSQLATGDVSGAQGTLEDFGTGAECTVIEAATRYLGFNPDTITYDVSAGEAYAAINVPNASDGTPCHFATPINFVTVSWGLYMDGWGVLPQWQHDTDDVAVTGSGTYEMTVGLPGPNADPAALEAAADLIIEGEPGEELSDAATGTLNVAADGITGIIGDFIGSLTPTQIAGLLDFICPAQVDTFQGTSADVPQTLAGGYGNVDLPDPNMSAFDLVDGIVVDTPAIAAAGRDSATAAANTLGASADGGGFDLANLDWEVLCVDPEPPTDVGGVQVVNAGTPPRADVGVDVAGIQTIPRTGSATPRALTIGIALVVAGWLVLTGNALTRIRRDRVNRV